MYNLHATVLFLKKKRKEKKDPSYHPEKLKRELSSHLLINLGSVNFTFVINMAWTNLPLIPSEHSFHNDFWIWISLALLMSANAKEKVLKDGH